MAITAVAASLSAIKTAKDLVESLMGAAGAQALKPKLVELQSMVMDAQASVIAVNEDRSTQVKKIAELEEQIAGFETWNAEKEKYELREIKPGVFAYALTVQEGSAEPAHLICANCYQRRVKTILQTINLAVGRASILVCNACGPIAYTNGTAMELHAGLLKSLRK